MVVFFLLQVFQRLAKHECDDACAGYHKQKVRHGFHLLSTEVLRNSVQPAATQWSAFHCRQTELNHIYCCPSILFHTVNEHIQNFVQIPITGAADSFSHGYAVPAPSKRELSDRATRNKAKPRFCTNSDNGRASRARYQSTERLTSLCWRSFSSSLQRILRTIHPDRRTSRRAYPSAEAERRQTPPCQSARAERRPF